jgi:hypothetical protein
MMTSLTALSYSYSTVNEVTLQQAAAAASDAEAQGIYDYCSEMPPLSNTHNRHIVILGSEKKKKYAWFEDLFPSNDTSFHDSKLRGVNIDTTSHSHTSGIVLLPAAGC